jgi:hypothetical protein
MEKILKSVEASMLDKALSLGRKIAIINSQPAYDAAFEYTHTNWFEYRVYKKGGDEIYAWETLQFNMEFDYNFKRINSLLNYLIENYSFPVNYLMYSTKTQQTN